MKKQTDPRMHSAEHILNQTMDRMFIGDYDACPCVGTHVESTAEILGFKITTASFDNEVLRIRFKLESPVER